MDKPTRLDYCQYLLSSPINYTLTPACLPARCAQAGADGRQAFCRPQRRLQP